MCTIWRRAAMAARFSRSAITRIADHDRVALQHRGRTEERDLNLCTGCMHHCPWLRSSGRGFLSSDNTQAWILNCGPECGGMQASVQLLDLVHNTARPTHSCTGRRHRRLPQKSNPVCSRKSPNRLEHLRGRTDYRSHHLRTPYHRRSHFVTATRWYSADGRDSRWLSHPHRYQR